MTDQNPEREKLAASLGLNDADRDLLFRVMDTQEKLDVVIDEKIRLEGIRRADVKKLRRLPGETRGVSLYRLAQILDLSVTTMGNIVNK